MDPLVGKTLSHYRVVEQVGAGGMGVVYRAEDTRLGRSVALKILPQPFVRDPVAMERFQREARAASALNHPNICTIHDIGEHRGRSFMAMEFLDGTTLRDLIQTKPLHVDEVLDLGIEIADALDAAHAKGIIHRDLKPSNIFVTDRGHAKVMDFGLAKVVPRGFARASSIAGPSIAETQEEHITSPGTAAGTVAYMSPEQARGQPLDGRSDLFSLGAVLYEMASGRRAFEGDTAAVVFDAILNRAPDPLLAMNPVLPPQLDPVIAKALEKDPELRYQTAAELRSDLKRIKRDVESARVRAAEGEPAGHAVAPRRRASLRVVLVGAAVVVLAVVVVTVTLRRTGTAPSGITPATWRQVTFTGTAAGPTLSPDGRTVAYASVDQVASTQGSFEEIEGPSRLMVQDIEGERAIQIARVGTILTLRWSPTGNELLLTTIEDSARTSFLLPRMGGTPRRFSRSLPELAMSVDASTIAGAWIGAKRIELFGTAGTDTASIRLHTGFTWLLDLDWSPDGKMLLFELNDPYGYSLWTARRDGSRQQRVYRDDDMLLCPRWAPQGGGIYCIRSSGRTEEMLKVYLSLQGGPSRRAPRVLLSEPELRSPFAVSRDGHRLVCTRVTGHSNVWVWRPGPGARAEKAQPRQLTRGTALISDVVLSPDGTRVAYLTNTSGANNVRVLSLGDSTDTQLTFMQRDVQGCAWSPDGRRIAFTAWDGDSLKVWGVSAGGGTPAAYRHTLLGETGDVAWAPGPEILYQTPGNRNYGVLDPTTGSRRTLVTNDSVGWMFDAAWSPDQKHVALLWNRPPRQSLWVVSISDASQQGFSRLRLLPNGWDRSGAGILAWAGNSICRVSYPGGDTTTVLRVPFKGASSADFTPDLGTVVYTTDEMKSDVWLVENFDPDVK